MPRRYVPARGDVVWLQFTPQAGYEQAGRCSALVLSPTSYNRKVGLGLFCPVTSQIRGYPFEVVLPQGLEVSGAVRADQVKSLDWRVRQVGFICRVPDDITAEVRG
ncbi:MAG: type II toxin-antitoxin system PemK/MazF family toxin, partial [Dehalococcoidia bacterium]